MKIAHVITRMILGGAQQNTLDSVRGLQASGRYDVTLITGPELGPEGDLLAFCPEPKPRILSVPSLKRNISPWHDGMAFLELFKIFTQERFDLVHTHSSKAGILARLAARLAGVKRVVHTVHGFAVGPYQRSFSNGFYGALERLAAHRTDVLMCVSESLLAEAKNLDLKPGKMVWVPSGFEWEHFENARGRRTQVRVELGLSSDDIVITKVARFFPLKGHEELFGVMDPLLEGFPQVKFLLVGGGTLQSHFEDLVVARGWTSRVLFTGLVPPGRVPDLLAASDVLVHTSLREGLARVIPQAFACSLPVVSFDVDGAGDLVKNGVTGFLVPRADRQMLKEALYRLVQDAVLRQEMGKRGHDLAIDSYDLKSMVVALDRIYQGV